MSTCIRCKKDFQGKYAGSKICKACSFRGMKRGVLHWNYKDGSYTYETFRKEIKESKRFCERCSEDLNTATKGMWCVHHKDHDHFNNEMSNLELLCKRCHQIEHECWKAFEGATTISKESSSK